MAQRIWGRVLLSRSFGTKTKHMRSSKSRSRNKSNRQRSMGNIVNRVFDSSGPEGKVRGTPQQIIDKYLMLARDAQLGNDRVAEQNFLQHAEHYTRMLGEAQAELAREQQERAVQGGGNGGGYQQYGQQGGERPQHQQGQRDRQDYRAPENRPRLEEEPQPELPAFLTGAFAEEDQAEGPGLVETPESAPRERREQSERQQQPERRERHERRNRPDRAAPGERQAQGETAPEPTTAGTTEARPGPEAAPVDTPAPDVRAPRQPRAPRKPRAPKADQPAAASTEDGSAGDE